MGKRLENFQHSVALVTATSSSHFVVVTLKFEIFFDGGFNWYIYFQCYILVNIFLMNKDYMNNLHIGKFQRRDLF